MVVAQNHCPIQEEILSIIYKNTSGQITAETKYNYNNQNKIIEIVNIGGSSSSFENWDYDNAGNLIKYTLSNNVAGVFYYYNFYYDSNNRIIKKVGTPVLPNLATDDYTYAYDPQNRILADSTHINTYYGQIVSSYRVYTYDNKNNIIGFEQFKRSNSIYVSDGFISIQYDNKQNPYFKIANSLYFGSGHYSFLSKNNILTMTPSGGQDMLIYEYYKNGLVRFRKTPAGATTIEYYYKSP